MKPQNTQAPRSALPDMTCDVHHQSLQASYIGDCEFGQIKFRQSLTREQIGRVAELISAAPDLLAALKAVLSMVEAWHEVPPTRFEQARTAIARAEGGRP